MSSIPSWQKKSLVEMASRMRKDVEAEPIDIHYDKLTDWLIRYALFASLDPVC